MKKLIVLFIIIILCSFSTSKSLYDLQFQTITGKVQSMSAYKGKKLLIVILPTDLASTSYLQSLDSISKKYQANIVMIGVPSFEAGDNNTNEDVAKWYQANLGSQFIVSARMYTKKASRGQSDLFRWLTRKELNVHFDMEAAGPGSKFFINSKGTLNGVFSPQTPVGATLINKMILAQ